VGSNNGRQSYFAMLDENTVEAVGPDVRLTNVTPTQHRQVHDTPFEFCKYIIENRNLLYKTECADQCRLYANKIVSELEHFQSKYSDDTGDFAWAGLVAVLVPGSPSDVGYQLLSATTTALVTSGNVLHNQIAAALPKEPGYGPSGLYFGPVENFAGLERPLVVVTGMQHTSYLVHRIQAEGWMGGASAVDPRVYLAVTRCSLELAIVEVEVLRFAAHFRISAADVDGGTARPATFVGDASYITQPSRAIVEPGLPGFNAIRYIRVGVHINLTLPPPAANLATAGVLSFQEINMALWQATTFDWNQCKAGVYELQMGGAFHEVHNDGLDLLRNIFNPAALVNQNVLNLQSNGIVSIPAELG
jgi:hypothetical protein